MKNNLENINKSISEIRELLGEECATIEELPDLIKSIVEDPSKSGYTTSFIFSSSTNPNTPSGGTFNTETGLVDGLDGDWSSTVGNSKMKSASLSPSWMSFSIFNPSGIQVTDWSTPISLRGPQGPRGATGEKGADGLPGEQGEQGLSGISYRTVNVYTSTDTLDIPTKPVGGTWKFETDEIIPPTTETDLEWYLNVANVPKKTFIWMSLAVFKSNGEIAEEWSVPVRLTGESGKDGRGIINIVKKYALNNDSQNAPTSGWINDISTLQVSEDNRYIWCKEITNYSLGDPTEIYYIVTIHGESGASGTGNTAPIIYPAGIWRSDKEYFAIASNIELGITGKIPYIYYASEDNNEGYYVAKVEDENTHSTKGTVPYNDPFWEKMEDLGAIYADIGVFNQALVGKWVFHGDYMFSQEGVTDDGFESRYDEWNDPAYEIANGYFIPNICFNAKTGDGWFARKKVNFNKDGSGYLGDSINGVKWDIEGNITIPSYSTDGVYPETDFTHNDTIYLTEQYQIVNIRYINTTGSLSGFDPTLFIDLSQFNKSNGICKLTINALSHKGLLKIYFKNGEDRIRLTNTNDGGFIFPSNPACQDFIIIQKDSEFTITAVGAIDPYYITEDGKIQLYGYGAHSSNNLVLLPYEYEDEDENIYEGYFFPSICLPPLFNCTTGNKLIESEKMLTINIIDVNNPTSILNTGSRGLGPNDSQSCLVASSFKWEESVNKVYTNVTLETINMEYAPIMIGGNVLLC